MTNHHDEFLKDENFTLVRPSNKDKFIKIVHDNYQTSYDEESMILTITEKTTLGALATREGMSVEELLESLERVD
jgi:hypothetical protein